MTSRYLRSGAHDLHVEISYDPDHGALEASLERCLVRAMMHGEITVGHAKRGVLRFATPSVPACRRMTKAVQALLATPPPDTSALRERLGVRVQRDLDRLDRMVRNRQVPHLPASPKPRSGRKPRTHRDVPR